ncbi:hypothetical protein ABW636_03065 [Aquimarina sp. 2201CG1-2-11]|uniref:hypothetical protein n=1 Tax=Aquimarina discodermiae TaxID=3231043 RepID=UPI0034618C37
MDNSTLKDIIHKKADTINGVTGNWKFIYKETLMLCITDETNNRMRIITPVVETTQLDKDLLLDSMTANFHSALDVKYAISNGVLWSVYIHPLKELSNQQVEDAISQVHLAAKNFGTTFSSTPLLFGTGNKTEEPSKEIEERKVLKF